MATIYSIIACILLQLVAVHAGNNNNVATRSTIRGGIRTRNENHRELIQSFANNFPSVTRDLHPQELKLKAHSSIHLGEKQPEIFASLESVLTPYFQEILGESLVAYDLKVKYSEGEDTDVADIIVTNMLVSCILTVRSNSVEELKFHTHDHANKWFFDFFDGLNVYKFLGQLRDNDIEVGEIVFDDEEFRSPLLNGGGMGGLDIGNISLNADGSAQSGGQAGAIAGAFVGVMVVGGVLAYRYKEKIPWDKIQEKSFGGSSATSSLGSSSEGSSSKRTAMTRLSHGIDKSIEAGKRLSATIQKKLPSKDEVNSKLDVVKSNLGPKLDVAKSKLGFIQERVSMYKNNIHPHGNKMPDAPDSPESAARKNRLSLLDSNPYNPFQDIPKPAPSEGTYSVGGDFGVGEEYDASTQRSPTISAYSGYGREIVFNNSSDVEEFSMPDDYNTVVADDYSVHCHSILGLMEGDQASVDDRTVLSRRPNNNTDDEEEDDDDQTTQQQEEVPSPAPSAVVPQSPFFTDMDEWSMDGYSLASRPAAPRSGRSNLNMPNLR
mmetsp:Transcript_8800/g.21067  ORF Transcript_8800/g.21067 Transcript_8800/m.21067 type:complete len:549 (+) Transcript_8800:71-1717(+)|eukprot:CAMPEP_0113634758 /NCGR_PEP_ID=MMETSP0017_2-20120614/18105_1 /TAXON_ID=2856 /ORGANISM="Cylindrotheca closterium" /LENGTH=548 /DNA_ID=CAMNT_0000545483 /DNA_START=1 /DNA_END=1647 /DNA_ORIENTATION=+ /assembly_acc=CAM_ASM_000147